MRIDEKIEKYLDEGKDPDRFIEKIRQKLGDETRRGEQRHARRLDGIDKIMKFVVQFKGRFEPDGMKEIKKLFKNAEGETLKIIGIHINSGDIDSALWFGRKSEASKIKKIASKYMDEHGKVADHGAVTREIMKLSIY